MIHIEEIRHTVLALFSCLVKVHINHIDRVQSLHFWCTLNHPCIKQTSSILLIFQLCKFQLKLSNDDFLKLNPLLRLICYKTANMALWCYCFKCLILWSINKNSNPIIFTTQVNDLQSPTVALPLTIHCWQSAHT